MCKEDDYWDHYVELFLKNRSLRAFFLKTYELKDYDEFKNELSRIEARYKNVFLRLPDTEKKLYRAMTVEMAKKWASYQTAELIKADIENFIFSLERKTVVKPEFNPNYFNQKGYDIFIYLIENYAKKGKVKYTNIWYFLKDDAPNGVRFDITQVEYSKLIKKITERDIVILESNWKKYGNFQSTEVPKMKRLTLNFS